MPTDVSPGVRWEIKGYLGSDLAVHASLAPRFAFSDITMVDTVSKTTGVVKRYTNGLRDGDSGAYLLKTVADNGAISIDAADLSDFAENRTYYVQYGRTRDSIVLYQGRKLLLSSGYTVQGFVYLTR